MGTTIAIPRKYDSKTVALYSIFLTMIIALEVFPIIGITDIPIPLVQFTIDWTGIPLILIFLFFGPVFSFIGIGIMGIAIGYRNPIGAFFKVFAEFFKILGIALVWMFVRKRNYSYSMKILLYTVTASVFCGVGMFFTNIGFLIALYGFSMDVAITTSFILIPWNIVQSIINVVGGTFLFKMIPEDLRTSFLSGSNDLENELILEED